MSVIFAQSLRFLSRHLFAPVAVELHLLHGALQEPVHLGVDLRRDGRTLMGHTTNAAMKMFAHQQYRQTHTKQRSAPDFYVASRSITWHVPDRRGEA